MKRSTKIIAAIGIVALILSMALAPYGSQQPSWLWVAAFIVLIPYCLALTFLPTILAGKHHPDAAWIVAANIGIIGIPALAGFGFGIHDSNITGTMQIVAWIALLVWQQRTKAPVAEQPEQEAAP